MTNNIQNQNNKQGYNKLDFKHKYKFFIPYFSEHLQQDRGQDDLSNLTWVLDINNRDKKHCK